MRFTQLVTPDTIRQGVFLSSKKRALEMIGKIVADHLNRFEQSQLNTDGVCAIECFSCLFKREKLGATGLNNGVALPHAKLPANEYLSLEKPIAAFLQLATPIDYEASDHKEVDLIFAIMFPEANGGLYREELQKIATRLSDKNLIKQLRTAQSEQEIWQVFEYADQISPEKI